MMHLTCIVIEDDISWQLKFEMILEEIGVTIKATCNTVDKAIDALKKEKPDFIIADILIGEQKVFDVFKSNKDFLNIPTVFATLSDVEADFNSAIEIKNHFYLVKPFHKLSLQSAIELVCRDVLTKYDNPKQSIIIKGNHNQKIEISLDKIIYIQQNQHYSKIVTPKQNFILKKSLTNLLKELNDNFLQIHRSYCVNKKYIQNFKPGLSALKIYNQELPIGFTFKEKVKDHLSLLSTTE